MKKKRWMKVIAILLVVYIVVGLDGRIQVSDHIIDSDKVDAPLKLALITDLHSCDYGEEAEDLMKVIDQEGPDVVLMSGDIIDDKMPMDHALVFLKAVSEAYTCYYVSGNHEVWTDEIDDIKDIVTSYGVTVLDGYEELMTIGRQQILITGIDDYAVGQSQWREQLEAVAVEGENNVDTYKVLLTHRPYIGDVALEAYYDRDVFDLVLTGHTHGGQWRFPGVVDAVFGPDQGLFPEFSGGLYELEQTKMILSRGLAKESTRVFRFYNRPEVVMITIQ